MKTRLTKSLAIILTAAMLICAAPFSGFVGLEPPNIFATAAEIIDSGTCGENLTWSLDSYGKLTISGTGAMALHGHWMPRAQ